MARAISASGRPLKGAGTIVTSPNGMGDCIRNVTRRRAHVKLQSNSGFLLTRQIYGSGSAEVPKVPGIALVQSRAVSSGLLGCSGRIYFSGWPMVTVSLPTPSTSHSILSPATVAATPDGVPVMMMSPAASSTISESLEMISGTFQII